MLCRKEDLFGITTKRKGEEKGPTGQKGGLTVQRLSVNVEDKCQKHSHVRPLTLVPCEKELTLENIKSACKGHFNTELECDVLAGERGPSFTESGQIQNWKVMHVRFVENLEYPTNTSKHPIRQSEPAAGSPAKSNRSRKRCGNCSAGGVLHLKH